MTLMNVPDDIDQREHEYMLEECAMEFAGVINYSLLKLGLSQIYLNQSKIEAIEKWFNPNDMSIFTPLPVHAYGNGKYTLTDGHSRAYVAYKKGLTHIPVITITMI